MLVVFSFCHKDAELALKQAQFVKALGGVTKHNSLVVCNAKAMREKLHEPIVDALSSAFNFVDSFAPRDEIEDGWPQSPNHIWVRTIQHVRDHMEDVPLLWMEPDAVPLVPTWVDQIEAQFQAAQMWFLGAWVQLPDILPHMSGVGVYYKTWEKVPPFACVDKTAWDVALATLIEPFCHKTKLIQHEWKPPTFVTADDLKRIRPEAVIYHQCKDGSLIDRLIESRGGVIPVTRSNHLRETTGANPVPATSRLVSPDAAKNIVELLHKNEILEQEIERLKSIIKPPVVKRTPGKRMKQRKPMSPETKAKMQKVLADAREKKRQKAMA